MRTRLDVPFAAVDVENAALTGRMLPKIESLLRSGQFIGGDEVAELESRFAAKHRAAHAVAVNSGTDALRLVLLALGIGRGATGITVANTFIATVGAMLSVGVRPLLVDAGEDENMDPAALERALTEDTEVVIAVHLRGLPVAIHTIREICVRRGIALVEDCAQAVLAMADDRPVGTFGIAGCFSLHPLKNLGACGDGGIVVTDDDALAAELRLMRNHGLRDRDTAVRWGENSRLDALQAALLGIKLDFLDEWTQRRRALAQTYDEALAGLPLVLPPNPDHATHVYHRYAIRTADRDELRAWLADAGVGTAVHYPVPIHRQLAAAGGGLRIAAGGLPRTERQARETLSLPLHPSLDLDQISYVAEQIGGFFSSRRGEQG